MVFTSQDGPKHGQTCLLFHKLTCGATPSTSPFHLPIPPPRSTSSFHLPVMRKGRENVNFCLFEGRDAAEQFPKRWVERSEASGGICHLPRHEFLLRALENVQFLRLCQQVPIAQGSRCVICSSRTCFVPETLAFCLFLSFFLAVLCYLPFALWLWHQISMQLRYLDLCAYWTSKCIFSFRSSLLFFTLTWI